MRIRVINTGVKRFNCPLRGVDRPPRGCRAAKAGYWRIARILEIQGVLANRDGNLWVILKWDGAGKNREEYIEVRIDGYGYSPK